MTMEKIVLMLVMCVVFGASHNHHRKFHRVSEDLFLNQVPCSNEINKKRNEIIEKSKCGDPKEVFVQLKPRAVHEQVIPGSVWVKRCVGLCDIEGRYTCMPKDVTTRHLPVRINNLDTSKESCATYPVEEHLSCQCCDLSSNDCPKTKVFNPQDS